MAPAICRYVTGIVTTGYAYVTLQLPATQCRHGIVNEVVTLPDRLRPVGRGRRVAHDGALRYGDDADTRDAVVLRRDATPLRLLRCC